MSYSTPSKKHRSGSASSSHAHVGYMAPQKGSYHHNSALLKTKQSTIASNAFVTRQSHRLKSGTAADVGYALPFFAPIKYTYRDIPKSPSKSAVYLPPSVILPANIDRGLESGVQSLMLAASLHDSPSKKYKSSSSHHSSGMKKRSANAKRSGKSMLSSIMKSSRASSSGSRK